MRAIHVQCESGPDPPPLPCPNAAGMELPEVEGIKPPYTHGDTQRHRDDDDCVNKTADPGTWVKLWSARGRSGSGQALDFIASQVIEGRRDIVWLDQQQIRPGTPRDGTGNSDGEQHECALIAVREPP